MDVRIINTKTGDVKFVAPHIANNERLLKSYGYVKQDLKDSVPVAKSEEKKELEPGKSPSTDTIEIDALVELTDDQVRDKYFEIFGKKPGNKKLETILKEIQEATIQK